MTTKTQLKKFAERAFIPALRGRGFECHKKFSFFKVENGIYKVIDPDILSSGKKLRFNVCCWVPEFSLGMESKNFPENLCYVNGGELSEDGLYMGGDFWDIGTEEEAIDSFEQTLAYIDQFAIPWFDTINTGTELLEATWDGEKNKPFITDVSAAIIEKY